MVRKQLCKLPVKLPRRILHLPVSFVLHSCRCISGVFIFETINPIKCRFVKCACVCVCLQRTVYRDRRNQRITGRRRILPGPVHRVRGQVSEKAVRLLLTRSGPCVQILNAYCTTWRQIHDELDKYFIFFLLNLPTRSVFFYSHIIPTSAAASERTSIALNYNTHFNYYQFFFDFYQQHSVTSLI